MVGVAAAMTALLGCGVVVLYNLPGMQEPSFGTDKALLRQKGLLKNALTRRPPAHPLVPGSRTARIGLRFTTV